MTAKQKAEEMAKRLEGDCDMCPCLKSCYKLGKAGIVPDCKTELTKYYKESTAK